jgi:uncharacterized protein (DUF736 family)
MAFEQKDGTGALFKNKRKETDTQPEYTGNGKVNGAEVEISAWLKKDKNGNTFMSLSFKPPYQKGTKQEPARQPAGDDGIPW